MGLGVKDEEDGGEAACFSAFSASNSSLFALTKSSSLKIWEWDDMLGGFCGWWSISMSEVWFLDELARNVLGPASVGGSGKAVSWLRPKAESCSKPESLGMLKPDELCSGTTKYFLKSSPGALMGVWLYKCLYQKNALLISGDYDCLWRG